MASKIALMQLKVNAMRNMRNMHNSTLHKSRQEAKEKDAAILKRQIDDMKSRDRWLKESREQSKKEKELCFKINRESDEEIAMEWLKGVQCVKCVKE